MKFLLPFAAAAFLSPAAVLGDAHEPQQCNFETHGGQLALSYEQIGADACIAFCAATEGCTAWLYTPHNFNPDSAPGECVLYGEAAGTRAPDSSAPDQFCGQMEG